jgi:hypothetical protein
MDVLYESLDVVSFLDLELGWRDCRRQKKIGGFESISQFVQQSGEMLLRKSKIHNSVFHLQ